MMWRNGQNRDGLRPEWWPASSLVKGEVLAGSVEGLWCSHQGGLVALHAVQLGLDPSFGRAVGVRE